MPINKNMIKSISAALKRRSEGEDGFSLVELLIVMVIIGILAAIAIPAFMQYQRNAKNTAVQNSLSNFALSMDNYYASEGNSYNTEFIGMNGKEVAEKMAEDAGAEFGFKPTEKVTVKVWAVRDDNTGYCATAWHQDGDTKGFVYDNRTSQDGALRDSESQNVKTDNKAAAENGTACGAADDA